MGYELGFSKDLIMYQPSPYPGELFYTLLLIIYIYICEAFRIINIIMIL